MKLNYNQAHEVDAMFFFTNFRIFRSKKNKRKRKQKQLANQHVVLEQKKMFYLKVGRLCKQQKHCVSNVIQIQPT